jgi:oligopeptide/dipeptide ABC transporter ATP-binding protein
MDTSKSKLLEVKHLKKHFPVTGGVFSRVTAFVRAVDDVSFFIKPRETFGLVGESGCGKTTVGRCLLRLLEPTSGQVFFRGVDLLNLERNKLRMMRQDMQIVFQNPFSSLDPRMTAFDLVAEPLKVNKTVPSKDVGGHVINLLQLMKLEPKDAFRYPHEFSGGQRQRIDIARALALNPEFLVLDEPTSALDISVQAQILKLLKELQQRLGLTYLFISHNLAVIRTMSDRVAVMYLGKFVEVAEYKEIFTSPLHPYTKALISAEPVPDPLAKHDRIVLKGEIPSAMKRMDGCAFHSRCPYAGEYGPCKKEEPVLVEVAKEHFVACHRFAAA